MSEEFAAVAEVGEATIPDTSEQNQSSGAGSAEAQSPDVEQEEEGVSTPVVPVTPEIKPYTDEEASAVLESGGKLDAKRLTPAQRLIQAELVKHTNKTWQEAANAKKHYEALAQQAQDPIARIKAEYQTDKSGTIAKLNTAIKALHANDPFDPNILELQQFKDSLIVGDQQAQDANTFVNETVSNAVNEVTKEIPDIAERYHDLGEFAVSQGMAPQDFIALTDPKTVILIDNGQGGKQPVLMGSMAATFIKMVNKFHKIANAANSAEAKLKKGTPPALVRSGSGAGSEGANTSTTKDINTWISERNKKRNGG